ncbi:MAG: ankyrin repeat domain-containing protein [Terracidiphilus sp.]|nr:ankyrin repeat domain-containing protein [Terracidiphilus sp.]MDR3799591.1 ankyrin repeat domain-containing protein [Terracidiphilus sp.]
MGPVFRLIVLAAASIALAAPALAQAIPASGADALIKAAFSGDAQSITNILKAGTDVNARTAHGETALMAASLAGKVDCMKLLISAHANVNLTNKDGNTALDFAALKGGADSVKILVEAKAEVLSTNADGDTALTMAARKPDIDSIKILLAAGADVNAQEDSAGESALMDAASAGSLPAVNILLAAGANPNLRSNAGLIGPHGENLTSGHTKASDFAAKFPDVVAVLRAAEAATPEPPELDGGVLETNFAKLGLDKNDYVNVSSSDLADLPLPLNGVKARYSPERRWDGVVTLRSFDASGETEYAVSTMVFQVDQNQDPASANIPTGAGTVLRVFGKAQLFGDTLAADGKAPLVFLIHYVSSAEGAKPDFATAGRLTAIPFGFVETTGPAANAGQGEAVFHLVHLSGTGSVKLRNGTSVAFK